MVAAAYSRSVHIVNRAVTLGGQVITSRTVNSYMTD